MMLPWLTGRENAAFLCKSGKKGTFALEILLRLTRDKWSLLTGIRPPVGLSFALSTGLINVSTYMFDRIPWKLHRDLNLVTNGFLPFLAKKK